MDYLRCLCDKFLGGQQLLFCSFDDLGFIGRRGFLGNQNKISASPKKVLYWLDMLSEIDEEALLFSFISVISKAANKLERTLEYNDLKKDDFYNKIDNNLANEFRIEVLNLLEKIESSSPEVAIDIKGPWLELRQEISDTLEKNTAGNTSNGKLF